MQLNLRKISTAFGLIVVSVVVSMIFMFANDKIFLQELRTEYVHKNVKELTEHAVKNPGVPVSIDVDWPLEAKMFFYGAMIFYWYLIGNICTRAFPGNPYRYGIAVVTITSLVFVDLAIPLYLLGVLVGIRKPFLKNTQKPATTAI